MDKNEKYDVFIAYGLKTYMNAEEAIKQTAYSVAKELQNKFQSANYRCFLMSPDNPNIDIDTTPNIAMNSKLFLLVVDRSILEKKKSGKRDESLWWYNELMGFMSQKEIGNKPQIAKKYVQTFTDDTTISDSDIQSIHTIFQEKNPIRKENSLFEWVEDRLNHKESNYVQIQNTQSNKQKTYWDADLARLWDDVYAPARPSQSEISFYREIVKKRTRQIGSRGKMLILGSTKPLIDMALNENVTITIIDSSKDYSNAILDSNHSPRIKIINCDWSIMDEIDELKNEKFDIIVGDMSVGNIPYEHFKKTISSISNLLNDGGYWLGKDLFHFSKTTTEDEVKGKIIKCLNENAIEEHIFANTVYHIASLSCDREPKKGFYKMSFNAMCETTEIICKEIKQQNPDLDVTPVINAYQKFSILHEKNISYYIYDIKTFVAEIQLNHISLRDVWYGDDPYSQNFPLMILEKDNNNRYLSISASDIESKLNDIYKYFPQRKNKDFAIKWTKYLPSQYYLVRLSKSGFVDLNNDTQWEQMLNSIKDVITNAVEVELKQDLLCSIKKLNDEKMDTEVRFIKNVDKLDDIEKLQMKETYQLAVLLYLSSVLTINYKTEKLSLFHLVLKKLCDKPIFDTSLRFWYPFKAPWVTAKVCTAPNNVNDIKKYDSCFTGAVKWLIDNYSYSTHNWLCEVGSHMDTCALCIDAILRYYNKLDNKSKGNAKKILKDILNTYVLKNNIYETIVLHPIGLYAEKKILSKTDNGESYQKKVLGSVAFISSLLKIINFLRYEDIQQNDLDKCKIFILDKLIMFWEHFKLLEDQTIYDVGEIDICTVPQILFLLSQALSSGKDTVEVNGKSKNH